MSSSSPRTHVQMLGQRVAHPDSTNFWAGMASPDSKRVKREQSTDSSLSRTPSESDGVVEYPKLPTLPDAEIPDSEAESDGETFAPTQKTELESALAPVNTDKEAIAAYEASRAAGEISAAFLEDRINQRKWVKGKSSIYVDAFNLALETVLEDESHLFDEAEMAVFENWRGLDYEAQYLYVRLFLRKTAAWHRMNKLGYYEHIANMPAAAAELFKSRSLPLSSAKTERHPGELEPPTDVILSESFTFADSSVDHITTLEEASTLLLLAELKTLAKDIKAQGKTKKELLESIRRGSQRQTGLGWKGLKRSETEESIKSEASASSDTFDEIGVNRDAHFVNKILASTGDCIRLSAATRNLFERVHLVFYRSTEWTENSLTTVILARISKKNFPDYVVSRSATIFSSRSTLQEFEAALRTQFRVDTILESNAHSKESMQKVKEISEDVYPRWKALLAEEQQKEDRIYESGEGAYLRRFSPAWVYTRIVHKGLDPLGRFKEREKEYTLLGELLSQRLFHPARRGAWYQRKALIEEHYMWQIRPEVGQTEEQLKRHWKKVALQTCEEGLQDRDCHLKFHYDLQKRVTKLEKSLKIAKRLQHDFGHASLAKPEERVVEGIRIEKEIVTPPDGARRSSAGPVQRRGLKTIWIDEHEEGGECGVEAMCLSWYRTQGWKGYHAEGGIMRTLFAYMFYDILFTYVPNVFQTAYQTCPLDLHTDAFYPSRLSEINHRLAAISNGEAGRIFREVYDRENAKETCIIGLDWIYDADDLDEIISCFNGEALATVCKVMAQEYQQRGGGMPDLFLWHPEKKEVMYSEVKSQNDRLSDTQRLWIHVLVGAGIRVELCNAVAKEVRVDKVEAKK